MQKTELPLSDSATPQGGTGQMKLPGRVSANDRADALWKRQYEALSSGEVLPECLEDQNLHCLDYYPLTCVLGRAFEQVGRILHCREGETKMARLFALIGRGVPYLGIRWQQSGKCSTLRLPPAEEQEDDPTRTLGIVALFPGAFNGKHHPAGRKPSSNEDRA
jgi:hypothetical protein